ncbi:hypothetical protein LJR071_001605 [Pseudomonas sp. LjRoot71]|uniref:hypothetical protein n=1 Tax=unclassified Pseudomonas TaxID=196821 RepID=UPI0025F13349|nr:hypothetical protein [Pseudomonas sp. UBA7530]
MVDKHVRILFGSGALFNLMAGLSILFAGPLFGRLIGMEPLPGQGFFEQATGFAIVLFGWMYWLVGQAPVKYRPYIMIGIIGKLGTVTLAFFNYWTGMLNLPLPLLTLVDLIYAALFWRYLSGTR